MADLFKPRGSQTIRQPTSDQQQNGRIVNPPRFAHFGGLSSAKKAMSKNNMTIKPPGDGQKII